MSAERARHRREARNARRVAVQGLPDAIPAGPAEPLPEGQSMAFQPAWCADRRDLPETRRATHDLLIALLGDARRGGVGWGEHHGQQARDWCTAMLDGERNPAMVVALTEILRLLTEEGGYLVVAMAPGVRG